MSRYCLIDLLKKNVNILQIEFLSDINLISTYKHFKMNLTHCSSFYVKANKAVINSTRGSLPLYKENKPVSRYYLIVFNNKDDMNLFQIQFQSNVNLNLTK